MQVYDGENLKDTDPRAKSYQEYRDYAGVDEGMSGVSTRFAFKIISKVFNFDSDRGRRQPGAPDVRAGAADRARAVPAGDRAEVPRLHQGAPGAALCRVHRQGNPDRLPRELQRVRPEHLRPLRHLRRLLDPGPGVPRHRHRRGLRPRVAERRAREDREAGRHRQPEGLPQRDRQLRAARARQQRTARTRCGPATRSCAR